MYSIVWMFFKKGKKTICFNFNVEKPLLRLFYQLQIMVISCLGMFWLLLFKSLDSFYHSALRFVTTDVYNTLKKRVEWSLLSVSCDFTCMGKLPSYIVWLLLYVPCVHSALGRSWRSFLHLCSIHLKLLQNTKHKTHKKHSCNYSVNL